ncbi:MAG: TOBE domain-containing protein, partial [Cyanobacteria bacterium]|nr:TOBE domain-containing protein [Cyanobacteriota bacterium]
GHLVAQGEGLWFQGEGWRLPLPAGGDRCRRHRDRPVILGIRPEDIHDPAFPPPNITPVPLKATVTLVEPMGNEIILHLQTATQQALTARVDRRSRLTLGETLDLQVNTAALHLFDGVTEIALT